MAGSPDRNEESLGRGGYFPISRIGITRGLEIVTGQQTDVDYQRFIRYQEFIETHHQGLWEGIQYLSNLRSQGSGIKPPDGYASGMMVFFAAATEHANENRLPMPVATPVDASSMIYKDGLFKAIEQSGLRRSFFSMFDDKETLIYVLDPSISISEKQRRREESKSNISSFDELAQILNESLEKRKTAFGEEEGVFLDGISQRWSGVDPIWVQHMILGAVDCKEVLQNSIRRSSTLNPN